MDLKHIYREKLLSTSDAASLISSGDVIFAGGSGCMPVKLVNAVCRRTDLKDIKLVTSTAGSDTLCQTDPDCFSRIQYHTMFMGSADRRNYHYGNIHINSVPYHDSICTMRDVYHVNVLMLEVSEPDENGYVYYGARGVSWGAVDNFAEKIILQINSYQQRFKGCSNRIHISQVTALCRNDAPLTPYHFKEPTEEDALIASHIIPLINDGDTLQIGIGGIPNAVGYGLRGKKHLGIHSEVIPEALLELIELGCVEPDRVVGSFALTSSGQVTERALETVRLWPMDMVNDIATIAEIPNFVSINATMMVDLTGQVASESIGFRQYSATGGQSDFVRGAALSKGGRSFLCLHSSRRNADGTLSSNIMLSFPPGTAVTTLRSDAMYIVTEYGAANIFRRPFEERIIALINIAHPSFRRELFEQAKSCGLLLPSVDISVINL